jgi:hypothetical protein
MSMQMTAVHIDRVKHPRDALDIVAIVLLLCGQFAVYWGPAACLVFYFVVVRGWLLGVAFLSIPIVGLFGAEALFNGTGLALDATGVHLRKFFGGPQLLAAWTQITQIQRVSRWRAWFVGTFLPWRMLGVSTKGVYVIDFGPRHYVVPADLPLFRQTVRRWRPDLMPLDNHEPHDARLLPPSEETDNPYQSPKSDLLDRHD